MTLWALLSDVHGRGDRLARVLADAEAQGAGQIVALGDIASANALALLDRAGAQCVFGNWEASGLRGLPAPYRGWVSRWPPLLELGDVLIAHASPVWPPGLAIAGVVDYLRAQNRHWTDLFPSLQRSEDARKAAFEALRASGRAVFFHGHTHVQEAWRLGNEDAPVRVGGGQGSVVIGEGERWLIGVGSAGEPHDGPGACYVLYDPDARIFTWRRV